MASSTSSSRPMAWIWTWLIALAISVAVLAAWETRLDGLGFRPSVDLDEDLWSWHRGRLDVGDERPLVLLGASRLLLNISMDELKRQLPGYRATMLGLNGKYPMAALEDFAADEAFDGVVVVSLTAQALEQEWWDMQQSYVDHFHQEATVYHSFDAWLRSYWQSHFAFANPDISLLQLARFYDQHGVLALPKHTTRDLDLSIRADFTQVDAELSRRHFIEGKRQNYLDYPPTRVEQWLHQVDRMNVAIDRIQARGGRVILLRLPTTGGHWELDQEYYPRSRYWDRLAALTHAEVVHFEDVPGLSDFDLPDTSHLDYRDRDAFTANLLQAIKIPAPMDRPYQP